MTTVRRLAHILALSIGVAPWGCSANDNSAAEVQAVTGIETPPASECPSQQQPETRAPAVRPEHERADFWLGKSSDVPGAVDDDAALLDADERASLEATVAALPGGWRDPLDPASSEPALIERELGERLAWLRERVAAGKYVEASPGALERAAARIASATPIESGEGDSPVLRFVVAETQLWCIPSDEGLYTVPVDLDFDRNRCASLHPGELVVTHRRTPDGAWIYLDAGHSVGWIAQAEGPTLGPPLSADAARERLESEPRAWLTDDFEDLRAGSSFPLLHRDDDRFTILVPDLDGAHERELSSRAPLASPALPFSRRAVFEQAFALLEQPYGWGGRDGQRDCSRYLHDLFAEFDLRLARNSGVQAKLGTRSVDLEPLDEHAKREAIRAAAREGVVLLYMPGHIMLYLGHDGELDYGISALSEYLTPCAGGPDTIHRLDKVAVTTLELGRGTERRAFIERITRMAVFGPDAEPRGYASATPAPSE